MLSNCGAGENLRVSWATRRSKSLNPRGNQSWIITGMTAAEAEALILWPFEVKSQLIGKDWCWERLKAKGQQKWAAEDEMVRSITDSVDMNLSKLWEIMEDRGAWHATVHEFTKSQTWLNNWTRTSRYTVFDEFFLLSIYWNNHFKVRLQKFWKIYKLLQHLNYF